MSHRRESDTGPTTLCYCTPPRVHLTEILLLLLLLLLLLMFLAFLDSHLLGLTLIPCQPSTDNDLRGTQRQITINLQVRAE